MRNEFLRHTLSTIAYRFEKAISNAEDDFGDFCAGKESRTPNEIINHMYQVVSATRIFIVDEVYNKKPPGKLKLRLEVDKFKAELKNLDHVLVQKEIDINYTKRLIQGPFSDMLTHIGQLSMLRGLHGNPIPGEDFSSASISTGLA